MATLTDSKKILVPAHEFEVLTRGLTRKELKDIVDESGKFSVIIKMFSYDVIEYDFNVFFESISETIIQCDDFDDVDYKFVELEDIEHEFVGVHKGNLLVKVTATLVESEDE